MPPKVKAKAKAKALPKAAGKAKAKAKARVASRRAGLLRKRPARAPLDGAGSPCASPVPEPELFAPVAESRFRREGKYHIKGKYLGVDAEAAVKIDSLVEDSLGKWAQVTLLGTNHDSLREWRLQSSAPLFISRVGVTTDQQVMDQELFYTREVGEIDKKITWITNLKDHGSTGGLSGINQLARELGYGGGQGVGPRERTPGGADLASPASPTKPSKKKRLRGRERVKAMLKDSQWSWKNSALDPRFKRPKIRLKRKKDKSSSSSTTETEKSNDSEEEDLFPEEDQIKYMHRKCPGLLTRHGIKQAKCRVLALQGEGGEGKTPEPVFVRYHRQIFAPQNPSAPLKREHLTLSTVLDCILRGEILKGSDILTEIVGANCARSTSTPCLEVRNSTTRIHYSREHRRVENSGNAAPSRTQGSGGLEGERQARLMGTQPAFDPRQHQRAEREQRFRRKGNSRERRQGRQGEQGRAIWENSYSGPDIIVDDVSRSPELTGGFSLGRSPEDAGADAVGCSFNSERHPARELKGALSRVGTELFLTLKKKAATAVNTGGGVFPLPMVPCDTPRDDHATDKGHWLNCLIASLNWMSGGVLGVPPRGEMNALQKDLVGTLEESMVLIDRFSQENFTDESMRAFWSRRIVNAYGEECHSAQKIRWANLIHSLPPKGLAGIVRGEESCTGGVRDFLINPAKYLKPVREWVYMPPPRIFVDEDDWPEVAAGLIDRGICEPFPLKDVIRVDGKPMVGGLFGVPKNENVDGVDVLRLIMDLRPVNSMFQSIVGDMSTLPMLSQLQPSELYPNETLLISSEDIKAMFYVVSLGSVWRPLLCFGRVLPPELSPDPHEEYVLSSLVLPMGFINSVAVAQALHRGIVHAAMDKHKVSRSFEIRRDQPLPQESLGYRIYLDNFDLLRRTNPEAASLLDGTLDPLAGALREEYSRHKVPRNLKKSAESQLVAEVQGAVVDGVQGIIYPKLEKVGRYFKAAYHLLKSERCDLKRMQVTLGGFNYLFSFRRPLMSIFNESWTFTASFEGNMRLWQPIPNEVKEELFAALSLS